MKRRSFDLEISDDEWDREDVNFNSSRVLKSKPNPSPPPIESFAFRRSHSSENSLNCIVVQDTPEQEEEHQEVNLEDDDVETDTRRPRRSRGRRFIVDEESDDEQEVCEVRSTGEDDEVDELFNLDDDDDVEEMEEKNVVTKALQKCAKISKELKKELYGNTVSNLDSYNEVENSNVRIVTQEGIDEACEIKESECRPVLKPYQLVGVNFLLLLYRKGIAGAILADEMGLGKTIQAITYLTLLKHLHKDPGPHLVVCPASLLENWEREFKKWCPSFTVLQYHGAARAAYAEELSSFAHSGRPPPFNVILVCYSLFERRSVQQKDDRKILKRWQWSCVLMDEAHALKDKNSYRWKNLMAVAKNANQRLMLTGTPLQNDLHELWSMLEFMMPDLFATGDVDLKKLLGAEDKELINQIKSILGPFILRRLKSDVMQQLVPKIQKVEKVDMERQQDEAYKEAIEEYRAASQARMSKLNGVSNSVVKVLPRRQISNYFFQFRKIANHPLLVRRIYSDADVVRFAKLLYSKGAFGFECTLDRVINELKSYSDFSIHQLLLSYCGPEEKGVLQNEYAFISAKCQKLAKLLPTLKMDGHRVLIFSQWTSMLDILEWVLDVIGVTFRRLDGSTQVTERQCIVDAFNNDTSIFACLLSTRAGGQGLNLTGADTVIIHDMDFNPQIDRQAEDRCHRIGQTKTVTIYRLVTKETVDEGVYRIAQRKLTLDSAVLKSGVDVDSDCEVTEKTMEEILSTLLLG